MWETNQQLCQEIEVRRLAEQHLSEAKMRYRTVADFTYDWEYWKSPEGLLLYCSPSCERITGYGSEELVANPDLMARMINPHDRNDWQQHCGKDAVEPEHRSITFRIHRKDGDLRWIDHSCQPVIGSDGKFMGVRGSNRDVTERKRAEVEVQKLRNDLAHVGRVTAAGQLARALPMTVGPIRWRAARCRTAWSRSNRRCRAMSGRCWSRRATLSPPVRRS